MSSTSDILKSLYEEQAQAVFRFALTLTRSEEDAEDILQEVFCRLARRPRLLRAVKNEQALLFRMTRNLVVDGSRRKQVRTSYAEGEREEVVFAATEDPDQKIWRGAVSTALSELPEAQRTVLHLKIWEDMTLDAIAKVLRIPPGTAASRFRYAMNKLEGLLRPFYEEMKK